jgi:DNA polymerase III delta prime subunit
MKKLKPIKKIKYLNCNVFKFDNTKVITHLLPSGEIGIEMRILSTDITPRSTHIVEKDKIVKTLFKITAEAAVSLILGLNEIIQQNYETTRN